MCACLGEEGIWELFVPSSPFLCKANAALKNNLLKNTIAMSNATTVLMLWDIFYQFCFLYEHAYLYIKQVYDFPFHINNKYVFTVEKSENIDFKKAVMPTTYK